MPRLFLSVDMAGATEFKTRFKGEDAEGWLEIFRSFFSNFPLMLAGQIGFEFLEDEATPAIDVWKVMGDEVLFVAEPASGEELTGILLALLRTLRLYEEKHFQALPLRLKGAAWLADVNGRNIQIEVPELSSGTGAHVDYIGPDIDLGFRISKFARPACLTVSLDILEAVLGATTSDRLAIYLMGREALKGVLFGRPYPILWMLDADSRFQFLPWEVDADPLMAAGMTADPTPETALRSMIADMRLYLRRVHGREWSPLTF